MKAETVIMVWLFLFGAAIGSFLNVCIYRLPRDLSLVAPGSRCPGCGAPVQWWDNLPILSYVLLRGRCRWCCQSISPRYMFVELLTGLLFVGLYHRFRVQLGRPLGVYAVYALLTAALIVSTFIDFDFRIIPNEITLTGVALAPVLSFLAPALHTSPPCRWRAALASVVGIVVSGGFVLGVGMLGKLVFRKEAMGLGDVKLMALVGGIAGWPVAVIAFFVAPFFGLLMGIPALIFRGKHVIPYGPFLSVATLIVLYWKPQFIGVATGRLGH